MEPIYDEPVELADMLAARERRVYLQQELIRRFGCPLICLTLNIPGPVKVLPFTPEAFEEGCRRIENALAGLGAVPAGCERIREKTGFEALYSVDGEALALKKAMISIEDNVPLGRLFDIDVLQCDGTKVSREDLGCSPRTCLLCGKPAHVCSRSRAHSVKELTAEISRILSQEFSPSPVQEENSRIFFTLIEDSVRFGLLEEVRTTPKPGLVDLKDSGAHCDMCYETFVASTDAVAPFIVQMARTGFSLGQGDCPAPLEDLFPAIRPIGVKAEEAMFAATGGVNTHKGMIFSLGIIAAAIGYFCAPGIPAWDFPILDDQKGLLSLCGQAVKPHLSRDFDEMKARPPKTHGEKLFARYGIRGIRGEAMDGFPALADHALPAMKKARSSQPDENAANLYVLLNLMSSVDDTNILTRSDPETLAQVKEISSRFLARHKLIGPEALKELEQMNQDFISQNISPGGCADLLAITLFFERLEEGIRSIRYSL